MNSFLTALAAFRGFVVYRLLPLPGGKTDKVPFDPLTGFNVNAQNPSTWMTPDVAHALCQEFGGDGLGLMIYEGSQLAFVDIDGCITDSVVSNFALSVIARFPGAVVEISASGRGIHIFFVYIGLARPHKVKNTHHHIECYTQKRFAALTGNFLPGHEGHVGTDHTAALDALLVEYFDASGASYAGEWTTVPAKGWDFLTDDDELIAWLLNFKNKAQIFGGRCPFDALWNADAEILNKFFPPNDGTTQAYDASSVDQATANHLAWATGNNCERVANLMRRDDCKLRRGKWDRDDYFQGTVAKACGSEKQWPTKRAAPVTGPTGPMPTPPKPVDTVPPAPQQAQQSEPTPGAVGGPPPPPPLATTQEFPARGMVFITDDQRKHFGGMTYVEDVHLIMMPDGDLIDQKRFDVREPFAGRTFQMEVDGSNPGDSAWKAFTAGMLENPKVRGQYFDPRETPGAIMWREGRKYVNSWQPVDIDATPGDYQWFIDHLLKLLPLKTHGNDAHILLQFLKFMVQHKGEKAAWFPFIQGVEGNGKSFISEVMQYCLGERYTHKPKAKELEGRFNSAFYGKLLIAIEDIAIGDARHIWETLKPMVDGKRLEIEYKGVDKVMREVCFNMIVTSNHKDGIPVTSNDRRVAPFFCAQQVESDIFRDGLTPEYFDMLFGHKTTGGWAALLHYLSTDPIDPAYNPIGQARRAPATSSRFEAKVEALGSIEQEILEAVAIDANGFAGGWISSIALDRLLGAAGKTKMISINKRRAMLATLGYVPHPGLDDGRVASLLLDGTKPRLYVKPSHSSYTLTDKHLIRQLFLNAQAVKV